MMITLFAEKENEVTTMDLYKVLSAFTLPRDVRISINNTRGGRSGILVEDGRVADISLANCYTVEDVVRELIVLIARGEEARETKPVVEAL
jgi:hypothetical protein